jgi:hypothetical protein
MGPDRFKQLLPRLGTYHTTGERRGVDASALAGKRDQEYARASACVVKTGQAPANLVEREMFVITGGSRPYTKPSVYFS